MRPLAVLLAVSLACGHRDRDDAEIVRRLEAFTDELARAGKFSGALAVSHDGVVRLERAWGLASRAWNAPNLPTTRFNLGSMNKMFTAVAIGQLLERGVLALDDTVGKHLPAFGNPEVRRKVTIRHLLTHTSGLGSFFNDEFEARKLRIREVRDYLPIIAHDSLAFEPGARWQYSNSGFILLGAIVEAASGENYFRYVRDHIHAPAGMRDTDCYDLATDPPGLATGYTQTDPDGAWRRDGPWWSNTFLHVVRGSPAGGGYSTVADLLRFAAALRDGTLLEPETVDEFTTGKIEVAPGNRYGFGFGDQLVRGHRIVGHGGGFPGINSNLDMFWSDGWVVAVMANIDGGARPVQDQARELLAR
ncbi:MAG TPA: serine hydrolase domain-containing protein [Kofleriaceae bacterium]|nr:serine hydrolase domain-containing protein [Kofleriaceae bacterium]